MEGMAHSDLKERTTQFSIASAKFPQGLPQTTAAQACGRQFLRSATSVGANTRSAFRGGSKKEFKPMLGVVIEEADERASWVGVMCDSGSTEGKPIHPLLTEADQPVSVFTSIIKR